MQTPKQELIFFESIKCGLEEAIAWKNGQTTGAVVRAYLAINLKIFFYRDSA